MALPGTMSIALLEEDNPQKSYFRVKPLLVKTENGYTPFEWAQEYPEDGCVRIVPDKNESSHFKARMRRMGKYARIDLREHAEENDKIRPNKNYRNDPEERNEFIVYSDVVLEPAPFEILEIVNAGLAEDASQVALNIPAPGTEYVLVRGENNTFAGVWKVAPMEGLENAVALTRAKGELRLEGAKEYTFEGGNGQAVRFMLSEDAHPLFVPEGEPLPVQKTAPAAEEKAAPQPAAEEKPAMAAEPAPVVRPRDLAPREQALLQQSGLNPRRGRCLTEIVEERYVHSRVGIDLAGQPVPENGAGQPIIDPVEVAVGMFRNVWQEETLREKLVDRMADMRELRDEVNRTLFSHAEADHRDRLNALEAERLMILGEIDKLEGRRTDAKQKLLEEVRKQNAAILDDENTQIELLRAEKEKYERQTAAAQAACRAAEDVLSGVTGENFDAAVARSMLTERAARRLLRGTVVPEPAGDREPLPLGEFTAGELVSDVRKYFEAAGFPMTNDEAVNLLACFALSPGMILSGRVGTGKTRTAWLLMEALGLNKGGRASEVQSAPKEAQNEISRLAQDPDKRLPIVAFMDNANLSPMEKAIIPALQTTENAWANPELRVVMTVQDGLAARTLDPWALDRCFFVRLTGEKADTAWEPMPARPVRVKAAVSAETLRRVFAPDAKNVPEEVYERMRKLRKDLADKGALISRRALSASWNYVASVTPMMRDHTPMQVLDLCLSQRVMPMLMASAPVEAHPLLNEIFFDMPACRALLKEALPVGP